MAKKKILLIKVCLKLIDGQQVHWNYQEENVNFTPLLGLFWLFLHLSIIGIFLA